MHSCAYVSVVYCNGCVVAVGKHSIIIILSFPISSSPLGRRPSECSCHFQSLYVDSLLLGVLKGLSLSSRLGRKLKWTKSTYINININRISNKY